MNEKLIKEIIMIKHNQATREKRKRERSEEKIKNKLKIYQEVILNKNIEQENKIKELKEKVYEIEKEKEFYKKSLERIPRFIIRLLGINKKYLGEGKW